MSRIGQGRTMSSGIATGGDRNLEAHQKPAFLEAENLKAGGVAHGFFMRTGGVSGGLFASLNCGRGSGDALEKVEVNRRRVAETLSVPSERLIAVYQCHSPNVVIADAPWADTTGPRADALVTATRGLAVSVVTADCAPILLADADAGVIAAVHAGWKGAKAGVIENAVAAMESLGARAARIAAAIGPAISQSAYEVGPEFKAAFTEGRPETEKYFASFGGERPHFDLAAYVQDRMKELGVATIQSLGACTYENESFFFSYRRSCHRQEGDYGRQISAIVLR
jgi:polyphenol oxidase